MKTLNESVESYIFDLDEHKLLSDSYCLISGIGEERRVPGSDYRCDCMNAPRSECAFQYTLSGEGAVVINHKTYTLHAGQAFLLEKPGPFRYHLPDGADHWSFRWISLSLPSISYWKDITETYGRIITLNADSEALRYWEEIYSLARRGGIDNVYRSSAHAYSFIMYLLQDLQNSHFDPHAVDLFQYCLQGIHRRCADPTLSLDGIAQELHVSPSYLARLFKARMHETYIRYLTLHRLSISEELLSSSAMTIEEIAHHIGLRDANYFSRLFRKHRGLSPSEYRKLHSQSAQATSVRAEQVVSVKESSKRRRR